MTKILSYVRSASGATAAEFALILPGLIFLLLGGFNLCAVTYAAVNLHSAVEGAARYASVQTNLGSSTLASSCATSTSVCYFVVHHYAGPGIGLSVSCSPSDCSASGCGHSVTGSGSYHVNYGFGTVIVPISATACFP